MTKEAKTTRNLKVIEQSGYRYQATPTVMLKGKWLSEFGFDIGTHVKVECEDGRLIITKEEARDEIVQMKGVSQNTVSKKLRRIKKQLTEMCRKAV